MLGFQAGSYQTMWWPEMAQTWPSGPSSASDIDFGANFTKATLIPNKKLMLGVKSGPYLTMWWLVMAQTCPYWPSPAPEIDSKTMFVKATLIPNK